MTGVEKNRLLSVDSVSVSYGLISALRDVSIAVNEGEIVALLGPNGAGKSTTLAAISGLVRPQHGEISLEGRSLKGSSAPEVVGLGVALLPEGRDLFPMLTVVDNLRLGYWVRRKDKTGFIARLDEVFDAFPKLRERSSQKAGTLSGGEQQMLAVSMALMSSPRLLLIDEMSLGLAPKVVAQLFQVLERINSNGMSILLVEQFVGLALKHSDRAYVLSKGRVVMSGKSSELREDPALVESYLGASATVAT